MNSSSTQRLLISLLFICLLVPACIFIVKKIEIDPLPPPGSVTSPVKVHLIDGRNVLFTDGAAFYEDRITGIGLEYSLDLKTEKSVSEVSMTDVAAIEVFYSRILPIPTILLSAAATAGAYIGTAALAVAIFGSCPTVYYYEGDEPILAAELFSLSIAPMLEMRDVVTLGSTPDENGIIRLEIRNEALETHYINHIELLEVIHEPDEFLVATPLGRPLLLHTFSAPRQAINSIGMDLLAKILHRDKYYYSSGQTELSETGERVIWDHIDMVFDPTGSEKVGLHFHVRNSLLGTVFFYDFMLSGRKYGALDWLGNELATVSGAVALGDFYSQYMGIRVEQLINGEYREVGRIRDVGPISWKDVALILEGVSPHDPLHLRLRFLHDAWQIDTIRLASSVEAAQVRKISPARIQVAEGQYLDEELTLLLHPDEEYFITYPGNRFFVEFETYVPRSDVQSGYLLAGQGYYLEWIRPEWLLHKEYTFEPDYTEDIVYKVQQRWREVKESFERQFFETKIPVH